MDMTDRESGVFRLTAAGPLPLTEQFAHDTRKVSTGFPIKPEGAPCDAYWQTMHGPVNDTRTLGTRPFPQNEVLNILNYRGNIFCTIDIF